LKINILKYIVLIFGFFIWLGLSAQSNKKIPPDFCVSTDENKLYESINQFLIDNGNKKLSSSISLSYVAKQHIEDLIQNHPDTSICNLSSWSDKGDWEACCYSKYIHYQDCMWDKPKELTNFRYRGYELALYFEENFNSDTIMQLLMSSNSAINMLLAKGEYSNKKWICMGVAINSNYASIWFAQREDKAGKPKLCAYTNTISSNTIAKGKQKYYIIVSSLTDIKDAKEAMKRIKQNGYDNAGILKSGVNIRVYLNEFESLKEAMYFKQKLPYTYKDAWILKE